MGRFLVVAVGLTVCIWIAAAVVASQGGAIAVGRLVRILGLELLLAAGFVSIAVALSAQTGSISRVIAAGLAIAAFFAFRVVDQFLRLAQGLLTGESGTLSGPLDTVAQLTPVNALENAVVGFFPELGPMAISRDGTPPASAFTDPTLAVLVLLGWVVGPLLLGYLRFSRLDR